MSKRRNQSLIESDSSDSESDTNIESELLSLAKKRKKTGNNESTNSNASSESSSGSGSGSDSASDSDSDSQHETDWDANEPQQQKQHSSASVPNAATSSIVKENSVIKENSTNMNEIKHDSPHNETKLDGTNADTTANAKVESDHEEGEVSDSNNEEDDGAAVSSRDRKKSSSLSSSDTDSTDYSSDSEFDDGYDENLMGDEEDRKRLNNLSEKERETEIFKRIEQRDLMRTRWEIERKLKLARRGERANKTKTKHKKSKEAANKNRRHEGKHKDNLELTNTIATTTTGTAIVGGTAVLSTGAASGATQAAISKHDNYSSQSSSANADIQIDGLSSLGNDLNDRADLSGKDSSSVTGAQEYSTLDHKERSKERKKNVEMNRTDAKRSNAMALLKAKREGKAKREEEEARRQAERDRDEDKELETVAGGKSLVKLKASEIYSDDSGSSDWEDDNKQDDKRSCASSRSKYSSDSDSGEEKEKRTPAYITTREDLNKIRLSRFKMERFINLPIFERTVLNCFVRISIGNNGQKPVYRVAEIVGVVETAKIYNLGKTRTNRGLRLKHGTQERVFRLEFISNQEFSETEFDKWRQVCLEQNVPMPTLELLERKQQEVQGAMNYEYKDEDVEKLVEEKNRLRNRPTNYAMRKTCLMKERDAAMLLGDYDVARQLGEKIEELESRASELDKKRSSSLSLISYINDRNRKRNVEDAEKAIIEEARANRGQRISDPFTRRITQPRIGFNKQEKLEKAAAPAVIAPIPSAAQSALSAVPEDVVDSAVNNGSNNDKSIGGATNATSAGGQADFSLYSLHDFEIDLDMSFPATNSVNVLPQPAPNSMPPRPKRSLNLDDYKKKRGLI